MKINSQEFAHRQRFLHGPAWRRQLGEVLLANPEQDGAWVDPELKTWCAFIRQQRSAPEGRERAAKEFGYLAAAVALDEDSVVANQLKVVVLAGCTPEAICARFLIDAKVLAAWEKVFFDVRQVRTALDWIVCKVIAPVEEQGEVSLAAKLKLACAGGPLAAEAALEAESHVLAQEGPTLFELKLCLHLKFQQAVQLGLGTAKERRFYLKMHADLMYREKQLQLKERQLEWKCQEALQKHELAKGKRELCRPRAAERAAQVAQTEIERPATQESLQAGNLERQAEMLPPAESSHPETSRFSTTTA